MRQERADGGVQVVKVRRQVSAQVGEVGYVAHGFKTGEHVGLGLGKEGVRVQEIRTAERVEHGGLRRGEIARRPGANVRELALIEAPEGRVEIAGMLLPGG